MSTSTLNASLISTTINENDKGASVTLAAALGLGFSLFFLLLRFFIRWPLRDLYKTDDAITTIATILATGQVIAVTTAVNYGLGERQSQLQASELRKIFKAIFASDILLIISLALAKLAVIFLVYRLTNKTRLRRAAHICIGIIIFWALLSIILVSIPCHGQFPWVNLSATCSLVAAKSTVIVVLDVVTEVSLFILPLCLLWKVQIRKRSRIFALFMFWIRIAVPIFSVYRLHLIRHLQQTNDYTFNFIHSAVMTQVLLHAALVFATVPSISPILRAFNTGYLVPDAGHIDNNRQGTGADKQFHSRSHESSANYINKRSIFSLFSQNGHSRSEKLPSTSTTPTSPTATPTLASNDISGMTEISLGRSRNPLVPLEDKSRCDKNNGNRNKANGYFDRKPLTLGPLRPDQFEHETTIEFARVRRRHEADVSMRLATNGNKSQNNGPNRYGKLAEGGVGGVQKRSSSCYDGDGTENEDEFNDEDLLPAHVGNDQIFVRKTVHVNFQDKDVSKRDAEGC